MTLESTALSSAFLVSFSFLGFLFVLGFLSLSAYRCACEKEKQLARDSYTKPHTVENKVEKNCHLCPAHLAKQKVFGGELEEINGVNTAKVGHIIQLQPSELERSHEEL